VHGTTTTGGGDGVAMASYMDGVVHPDAARSYHEKLGHAHPERLASMVRKGLLAGVEGCVRPSDSDMCRSCLRGKQTRAPVRRGPSVHDGRRPSYAGEVVHIDLTCCGSPMVVSLKNGGYLGVGRSQQRKLVGWRFGHF
jgi:hypothetical protein